MDGASLWMSSPAALENFGPCQTIVDVPTDIPSTVHIKELESDSGTNGSWDLMDCDIQSTFQTEELESDSDTALWNWMD